jgi:hypothetical protein
LFIIVLYDHEAGEPVVPTRLRVECTWLYDSEILSEKSKSWKTGVFLVLMILERLFSTLMKVREIGSMILVKATKERMSS